MNKKVGRKKIEDPCIFKYSLKLNRADNEIFLGLFKQTGLRTKAQFLYSCVFEKEIPVRIIRQGDRELLSELSNYNRQIRMLGVNYNQVVREFHIRFSEKNARFYIKELVEISTEIAFLSRKIIDIALKYDSENNRR